MNADLKTDLGESGAKATAVQTLARTSSILELREAVWTAARSPLLLDNRVTKGQTHERNNRSKTGSQITR